MEDSIGELWFRFVPAESVDDWSHTLFALAVDLDSKGDDFMANKLYTIVNEMEAEIQASKTREIG